MVKRYTPETRISSNHGDYSEHKAICYQHPEGEYVKYDEYQRVVKELNNLKFGKHCISIAKKTNSEPKEVLEFAQKTSSHLLSGKQNKRELLSAEMSFVFKDKKLSGSDIKKIILKQ